MGNIIESVAECDSMYGMICMSVNLRMGWYAY